MLGFLSERSYQNGFKRRRWWPTLLWMKPPLPIHFFIMVNLYHETVIFDSTKRNPRLNSQIMKIIPSYCQPRKVSSWRRHSIWKPHINSSFREQGYVIHSSPSLCLCLLRNHIYHSLSSMLPWLLLAFNSFPSSNYFWCWSYFVHRY